MTAVERIKWIKSRFGLTAAQQRVRALDRAAYWDRIQAEADAGHVRYVPGVFRTEADFWRGVAAEIAEAPIEKTAR